MNSTGPSLPPSVDSWRNVKERGSAWGMFFTVVSYRFLGRGVAEVILRFITFYFFITNGKTRAYSRQYLQKVKKFQNQPAQIGWKDVYRHYLSFAQTSLDRVDVWSNRINDYSFNYHGHEHVETLLKSGQGAILIGGHFGNFDALRSLGKLRGKTVRILTDRKNSKKFTSLMKRVCPGMEDGVYEYDSHLFENIFELRESVKNGEFIGLLGDRMASQGRRGMARVSWVPFLGSEAPFPHSPYKFAALLECPVLLIFSFRKSYKNYDVYIEPLAEKVELDAAKPEETLQHLTQLYASRLEKYCLRYPFQWFNFYDFWRNEK